MSHEATNWAVKQRGISPGAKVVLWHLADRHNPDFGCFPSQEKLARDAEMSRRGVNYKLEELEKAGLIRRIQTRDEGSKRQNVTRYILGFEEESAQDTESRVQDLHMEAVCKNEQEPCAKNGESRVQTLHSNLVREPLREPVSDFDAFWGVWPHKVGKDKARAAFKRLSQQNQTLAIERLGPWLEGWRKQYPDANHIHASTYLNGKRWEDDFGQSKSSGGEIAGEMLARYAEAIRGQTFMAKHASREVTTELLKRNLVTIEECRRAGVA